MGAEIYVYCPNAEEGPDRSDLEDLLEGFFGAAARLTGGGGGTKGFNIDFELNAGENADQWADRLRAYLQTVGVRHGTAFEVFEAGWKDGMEWRRVEVFGRDRRLTARDS
jgi:hypothetical protein